MFTFLVAVVVAQSPAPSSAPQAARALDALEHALVPTEPFAKLSGSTDDTALTLKNWSLDELRELHLANERTSTASLVAGGIIGLVAGGGLIAADLLPKPGSLWAGALTSTVLVASVVVLAALASAGQTFGVMGVATRRTTRLRKAALMESEWDPVVVDAANRVLTTGVSQTSLSMLEGEAPLSVDAFEARIASRPEWVQLQREATSESIGALLLMVAGLLVFAAPATVVGALELPTLANVGLVAGGMVAGLLILLGAAPLATAADAKQSRVLDEYNAAVFARARAALPPPRAAPVAPSLESVPPTPEPSPGAPPSPATPSDVPLEPEPPRRPEAAGLPASPPRPL